MTHLHRIREPQRGGDLSDGTDLVQCWQMSAKAPLDVQAKLFDALSSGNTDAAAMLFAEECTFLFPGLRPVRGRALVTRTFRLIRRRYNEISWQSASDVLANTNWIVSAWTVEGTFKGSGLSYKNEGLSLIRLNAQGQIVVLSDYFKDTLSFKPQHVPLVALSESRDHESFR